MLSFLKDHPFAVEAFFESSLVFTFALPTEKLQPFLPPCLSLDTLNDQWAFLAVAMVQTKGLRPKGFPAAFGNDFFLTGYRIFTRYHNNAGKNLRGLYILRSQTDQKKMEFFGNIFTHYNYTTIDITQTKTTDHTKIVSRLGGFEVEVENDYEAAMLPEHSPFTDWKEARRFAGPLPFTFTYNETIKEVLIIEGVREQWTPKPLKVIHQHFSFLQEMGLEEAILANAFIINNIPYYWKKGKKEIWSK